MISIIDDKQSFWWFAGNAKGENWNDVFATELSEKNEAPLGGEFNIWWTSTLAHNAFPYIFSHTSNREVIPAYSFTYASVDKGQYQNSRVSEGPYLKTISLGEYRTRLSPGQLVLKDTTRQPPPEE